ncbi:MAG TPA: hypothetical protein VFB45_14895 [Pseudolabrys sp.]|nr:hypothetical protein [Pseudolabrys sp.]
MIGELQFPELGKSWERRRCSQGAFERILQEACKLAVMEPARAAAIGADRNVHAGVHNGLPMKSRDGSSPSGIEIVLSPLRLDAFAKAQAR